MHRLAAQKLADAGAQHGPAIAHAGVGREAGAFELDFKARAGRVIWKLNLAQQYRPPIAQLPGPLAKLVTAVDAGQRLCTGQPRIAAEGVKQQG